MSYKGIDVSSWQKNIDWNKVAKEIDFVMIRCGFGNNVNQIDNMFKSHITGAIKAGIKYIGIYHFSYARSVEEAKTEANVCLKLIEPYKKYINLPVAFDWEYDSRNYCINNGVTPTRSLCDKMAQAFCSVVKSAGYKPMLYTNPDYANRYFTVNKYEHLWIAQYAQKCQISNVDIWQYSSTGKVNGISGNVDMNYCYNKNYFKGDNTLMNLSVKSLLRVAMTIGIIDVVKLADDAVIGEGTKKCLKAVQKKLGITQNGEINEATVKGLDKLIRAQLSSMDSVVAIQKHIAKLR